MRRPFKTWFKINDKRTHQIERDINFIAFKNLRMNVYNGSINVHITSGGINRHRVTYLLNPNIHDVETLATQIATDLTNDITGYTVTATFIGYRIRLTFSRDDTSEDHDIEITINGGMKYLFGDEQFNLNLPATTASGFVTAEHPSILFTDKIIVRCQQINGNQYEDYNDVIDVLYKPSFVINHENPLYYESRTRTYKFDVMAIMEDPLIPKPLLPEIDFEVNGFSDKI